MRRSELKFRQLAETIHEVFWISDIAGKDVLYVSPAYREIFGRTYQSFYEQSGSFLESVHPGDAERVRAAAAQQEQGVPLDEEFRIGGSRLASPVILLHSVSKMIANAMQDNQLKL